MPKFPTFARRASHPDGKKIKKTKHRGHQYRDAAAKARKVRQTRIKGIVEEIVETVEPGRPKPLKRGPKYDFAKIERKLRVNCEESQPVNIPIIPAEVYGTNPVNFNVPRVIIPTSEATAKRKQVAAGEDDGDATDVDDSEDNIVVPAGFVEAAEKLGLLSVPATSSSPHDEPEKAPSPSDAQSDEKTPAAERLPTGIKTPPSPVIPYTSSSAPSPSPSPQLVPEPVLVEAVYNDSQTTAATSSPTYPESSEPISVPQAASIPESFQEVAWSSASQHQNSIFWDKNMNDAQTFTFHQQDVQNTFYPGSTSDDVNMEVLGEATIEPFCCSTTWIAPQEEHQTFWSFGSQVGEENNFYQTHDNVYQNWARMSQQSECIQQSTQINQPSFTHTVDPLAAASCFWTALSRNSGTYQSPTSVQEPASILGDAPRPPEEPSNMISPKIRQSTYQNVRRYRVYDDRGLRPFSSLRGPVDMIGELGESRIVQPMRRFDRPSDGSEEDMISCLRTAEAEGQAPQMLKVKHRKRQREDSQPDFTCTGNPDFQISPRQRRRCEPDVAKLKTPVTVQKRSCEPHWRYEAPPTRPTSSRTPNEWTRSRFCPSISSLANRLFKLF